MFGRSSRHYVTSVLAAAALTACAPPSPAACPTPSSAPPAQLSLLPPGLTFDTIGPVTHVLSTSGHITVQAVSTKPIDELTVLIQDAVVAAGYRPAGMDNEGFEAEVFFTSGTYAAGQAVVRKAPDCDGRWNIELVLIDPSIVPTT